MMIIIVKDTEYRTLYYLIEKFNGSGAASLPYYKSHRPQATNYRFHDTRLLASTNC